MFSKRLSIPFFILLFYTVYITAFDNQFYSKYIIPPFIILSLIYVFSNEIDWWYYQRRPPAIPKKLVSYLKENGIHYTLLTTEEKKNFNTRLSLYLLGNEFQEMNPTPDSQSFKVAAAYFPVLLSLHKKNYLLEPFERIIFYNHPFPSPQNQVLHHSEIDFEDNVLVFNKKMLGRTFGKERTVFSVALYEYSRVMITIYDDLKKVVNDISLEDLTPVIEPDLDKLKQAFNYKEIDEQAIILMAFWTSTKKFSQELPNQYNQLSDFFGHSFLQKLKQEKTPSIT